MNLATARSAGRAREVGLRKVVGAKRNQLIRQFLSESIVTSIVSLLIALGLVLLILPRFNLFLSRNLSLNVFDNAGLFLGLIVIAVSVGLISGLYPAVFLSGFKPVRILKGNLDRGRKGFFQTMS